MELSPCPVTGSRDFTPWLDAPDRFDLSAPSWKLVRSAASGLVMLNPRPEASESHRHYPAVDYDPFIAPENCRSGRDRAYLLLSSALLRLKAGIVMKGLKRPAGAARLLDAGCSTGRLLMKLHRLHGIPLQNLFGVEPDHGAATAARHAGLKNIAETDFADTGFDGTFDRIVFWHSLEHIYHPGRALSRARDLLAEDGMLVIALPNIDSEDALRYGKHWVALDAPRHLYHFTPATLGSLLDAHGFSTVDVTAFVPDALYNVWYSERLSCAARNKGFGLPEAIRAASEAARSIATGLEPRRSSGFVCRAVRSSS